MGCVLGGGHATITDFEHVGIVPSVGPCERFEPLLLIEEARHAPPVVADVPGGPPKIPSHRRPEAPRSFFAPIADAVDDAPPRCPQGFAHCGIARAGRCSVVVAVVV